MRKITSFLLLLVSLSVYGQTAENYLDRGLDKFRKKDYGTAMEYYNKAIALDNKLADAYYERAYLEIKNGNLESALLDLTKTIELDELYLAAYFERANIYQSQKKYPQALANIDRVIEVNEKYPQALGNRAALHRLMNNQEASCQDLRRRVELNVRLAVSDLEKYCNVKVKESLQLDWPNKEDWQLIDSYLLDSTSRRVSPPLKEGYKYIEIIEFAKNDESLPNQDLTIMAADYQEDYPLSKVPKLFFNKALKICNRPNSNYILKSSNDASFPFIIFSIECQQIIETNQPASQIYYIVQGRKKLFTVVWTVHQASLSKKVIDQWVKSFRYRELTYEIE